MNTKNSALLFLCCVTLLLTACSPSAESLYEKGCKYQTGNGVSVDEEKALYFYHKAANKGYAKAQYTLGDCYSKGVCALQDKTEAAAWYKKASDKGLPEAQFAYGNCLYNGDGVAEDKVEAVDLITKASEQGYEPAERFLEDIGRKDIKAGTRKVVVVNDVEFAFRYCPEGSFTMGSPKRESGREDNETQRQVTLTKGFWIMETELTQKQWKAVMGSKPESYQGDEYPVEYISWIDCQKFCVKCSQFGLLLQLPTEAQWEYACRAGNDDASKQKLSEIAWYSNNSNGANAVGTKTPNAWGLYDMYGNVWEWCTDWYGDYPDQNDTDPTGPVTGSNRVNRGGSWNSGKTFLRAARRADDSPNERRSDLGARFVIASDVSDSVQFVQDEENTDRTNVTEEKTATEEKTEQRSLSGIESIKSEGKNAGDRAVIVINDEELAFRWCPAGTFMMGSPVSEFGRNKDEKQHQVTLTKGFWMLETEVTQKQWRAVTGHYLVFMNMFKSVSAMEAVKEIEKAHKDSKTHILCNDDLTPEEKRIVEDSFVIFKECPVNPIWSECQQFFNKFADLGVAAELPTEAQWEYACRAGTTKSYSGDLDEMAWYDSNSDNVVRHVGKKSPNPWGLYDMYGNVWEYCQDWLGSYSNEDVTDPTGPSEGKARVIRGGSVNSNTALCRSACRQGQYLLDRHDERIGFRFIVVPGKDDSASKGVNSPEDKAESGDSQENASKDKNAGKRAVKVINGVEFAFRYCPAGTFMMGDDSGGDEYAVQHKVTLTKGFWILETEISQKQWKAVMGNNPSRYDGDDLPVEDVSWKDCQLFCKKCSKQMGVLIQLPTEAQWEYACRAGTTGSYAGSLYDMAWLQSNSDRITHPVGTKKPNAWGLYDMHGNVWEWTQDFFEKFDSNSVTDPTGAPRGDSHVCKGGSCEYGDIHCQSSYRDCAESTMRPKILGFRIVISNKRKDSSASDIDASADNKYETEPIVFQDSFSDGKKAGDRAVKVINDVEFAFRWCPPGSFMMGSPEDEEDRGHNELQHKVTLTKGFWIMETEVSQRQWEAIMGNNPSHFVRMNFSVTKVSWNDCQDFCEKCQKLGLPLKLPTEAQWEYACRAGTTGAYAGDLNDMVIWNPYRSGLYKPNSWGIHDMHGNVSEWCEDWYAPYSPRGSTDPTGPSDGTERVKRGGNFYCSTSREDCRSASRSSDSPDSKSFLLGFRCVIPNGTESSNNNDANSADGKNDAKSESSHAKFVPGKRAGDRLIKNVNGVKIAFRWCPPGTFMMGTPGLDEDLITGEKQHKVTLTKGFWIMETEVTVGMFNAFVNNTKYESQGDVPLGALIKRDPDFGTTDVKPKKDPNYSWRNPGFNQGFQHPVTCVSWLDAEAFCEWLGEKTEMNIQLPTEAQWEYACRVGKPGTYAEERDKMAWYTENSDYSTHPVGKKKPNAWGLYDMLGNVWEWCEDCHCDYSSETAIDPVGDIGENSRNIRGGSWLDKTEQCQSELRASNDVKARNAITGFRCVIVP